MLPAPQTTPPDPASASSTATPWKKSFPNGTIVELLGVTMDPATEAQWQSPDGKSRLATPPIDPVAGRQFSGSVTQPVQFEAVFHLTRFPNFGQVAYDLIYDPVDADSSCALTATDRVTRGGARIYSDHDRTYIVRFGCNPAKGQRANLRVGIHYKAGTKIAEWTAGSMAGSQVGSDGDVPIQFRRTDVDEEGGLRVTVSVPRQHGVLRPAGSADYKFVAEKKDGTLVTGLIRGIDEISDGPPRAATFAGVKPGDVVAFRLFVLPYIWVDFPDVPLREP